MVSGLFLSLSMKGNSISHSCSFPFQASQLSNPPVQPSQLPNPPIQPSEQSTIDEAQVTLTEPTPDKVPASYKQLVKFKGGKLILQTANYYTSSGLLFYCNHGEMKALAVPVDEWLRTELTTIEKAVLAKVTIPPDVPKSKEGAYVYKPLQMRDNLFLTVSKFCKYLKYVKSKGAYILLDNFEAFERGQYNVDIEVAHVYIGPHKGGQNFSLSLRITQIMYREDDTADFHLDEEILNRVLSSPPLEETVPEKKKKAVKRGTKKAKCETPLKAPKNVVTCSA